MAQLKIYDRISQKLISSESDPKAITSILKEIDITYEVWQPETSIDPNASPNEILNSFQSQIEVIKKRNGFKTCDVISVLPSHPNKLELRQKFLSEHIHSDDEARYFVDGCGLFYIHQENTIYGILCEKGDLINVPAGTKHWFDMGAEPNFKCIRVFTNEEGWVATYTGDKIANNFPTLNIK